MADDEKDEDMTLEQREQWLRDRGVLIENPREDARNAALHQQQQQHDTEDGALRPPTIVEQIRMMTISTSESSSSQQQQQQQDKQAELGSVQFVWIPQDTTKPLKTLRLPASLAQEAGDSLPNYVKSYFADSKSIDASLLQQQATKHFAGGQLKDLAATNISTAAMNSVAAQGTVETFSLVHPADTNHYTGVYIYLDEVGLLKKLPANTRASQLAAACGYHPPPNFYGDVFVGRVATRPTMTNIDFVAGRDTDRSAEWMVRAVSENVAWQQEYNQATGQVGATQPSHVGTEGVAAKEEKFTWTQEDDELEICIPLVDVDDNDGSAIDKSKLKVLFHPRSIVVKYKGKEYVSIKLYDAIDVDGCTWTLDGKTKLVVTCEKAGGGGIWPRIKESN
jgi:CS domain